MKQAFLKGAKVYVCCTSRCG